MAYLYESDFTFKNPDPNRLDIVAYYETPANTTIDLKPGDTCLVLIPAIYTEGATEEFTVPYDTTNNVYSITKKLPDLFEKTPYWNVPDLICVEDVTHGDYIPYVTDASVVDGTTYKKGFTYDETTNQITIINKTGAQITVKIYYIPSKGLVTITHSIRTPDGIAEKKIVSATCSQFVTRDLAEFPVTIEYGGKLVRGHALNIKVLPRRIAGTPTFKFVPFDSKGDLLPIVRIEIEIDASH